MHYNKTKKSILNFFGVKFSSILIPLLCRSLRINEIDKHNIQKSDSAKQNYVVAFWHGKMLVPWYLFRDTNSATIISASRDGNILTKILEKWNYLVKRGSSSKGGKEVLDDLLSEAKNGRKILITPDGPRGPQYKMKAGAIVIAKKCNIPLVLISVSYNRKFNLKSWDKFEIPLLFSKVNVKYSEPYYFDSELSFDETNEMINKVEKDFIKQENDLEKFC